MLERQGARPLTRLALPAMLMLAAAAMLTPLSAAADSAGKANNAAPDAITLTSPNNVTIAETDDYATQVLGDPWDMNNADDVDRPYKFQTNNPPNGTSGGLWTNTTTAGDAHIFLQSQSFSSVYSYVGEKDGVNLPINTSRYSRLKVRLYAAQGGTSRVYWFSRYGSAPIGSSDLFTLLPGWNIYDVDLAVPGTYGTGNWRAAGEVEGLRFDAPWNKTGNRIQLDWARLTPDTGNIVSVNWTHTSTANPTVKLYLSLNSNATEGNEHLIGSVPANNRAFRWVNTGVAPGTYYIHAEMAGEWSASGPLHVNPAPVFNIDAPSAWSGEDFANARLGVSWDSKNSGQFPRTDNVRSLAFNPDYLQASATTNDPVLYWQLLSNTPIDTNRYRYMNIRFMLQYSSRQPSAVWNGGPRVTWARGNPMVFQQTKHTLAEYGRWIPSTFDLKTAPLEGGGTYGWTGNQNTLRFDVHEEVGGSSGNWILPDYFRISHARLTSMPIAGRPQGNATGRPGTLVRWTPIEGGGTVDIGIDLDRSGFDGAILARDIPFANGSYQLDTSGLANGTYWVYMKAQDSYNSSQYYSQAPVVVDQNSESTIFTDVPTNYFAARWINDLAVRGITDQNVVSNGVTRHLADSTILYHPSMDATRSELTRMAVLGADWAAVYPARNTFADVDRSNAFYGFIEAGIARGVIGGYPCGGANEPCDGENRPYFRPNNNVTRAQTAKILTLSRTWPILTPSVATFTDMPPTNNLFTYVETVAVRGIIGGYPCGGPGEPCDALRRAYYRPGNNVTRAQLAKMVSGALGN